MDKLRVGVVGCGGITTHAHLPILHKIKDINIGAICTRNEEMAKNIIDKFNIRSYYADYVISRTI